MGALELKDPQAFFKQLDKLDLENPEAILVSGADLDLADQALSRLRRRLAREIGSFEFSVYAGEPGDAEKLAEELFNIPLFAPYRLFLLRQGQRIAESITQSSALSFVYSEGFQRFPGRTLLLISYEGAPSARFLKLLHGRFAHLPTRELYANQMGDAVTQAARRLQLHLSEDAIAMLREQAPPRAGAVEALLERLHDMLPEEQRKATLGPMQVRDVLFPTMGVNPFALTDALFSGDFPAAAREVSRFHPNTDNFFGILKVILKRTDEIRKASICLHLAMNDQELLERLDLKGRPPFVQKKILARLKFEVNRFSGRDLSKIYELLIELQQEFRSQTPPARQRLIFEERVLGAFF